MVYLRFAVTGLLIAMTLVGCSRQEKIEFEPNHVFAMATELRTTYPMKEALQEAQIALTELFGTPDQPKLPEFLEEELKQLVNFDSLLKASGPIVEGRGLYRMHCISCHGITGNGRGINALQADVYPRDFRMGKFKFKCTPRGTKPVKDDLFYTIRNGIAGTPMQMIKELSDQDVEALVDYVIYLAWRGEVERKLISAGEEIEFENGQHLYAPGSEGFAEQQMMVQAAVVEVAENWLSANQNVKQAGDPGDIPVDATLEQLIAAARSDQPSPLKSSIERGKLLFGSENSLCYKCHGPNGHGDGQTQDYDDWTKDWSGLSATDVIDEQALIPLMARGAMPPRKIMPRDLRLGVYRGGATPERLYLRIANGIDGTPMPAAIDESVSSAEGKTLSPADVWDLVNFVRSLALPSEPK